MYLLAIMRVKHSL